MIKRILSFLALAAIASAAPPTIWDGVFTAEQAARGRKAYTVNCVDCHGEDLKRVEDDAKPLAGDAFLKAWNGKSVGRLIDVTKRTMPTDQPNSLSRKEYTDLVAFVLSVNGFPAGQAELDPVSPLLKEIYLEPKK